MEPKHYDTGEDAVDTHSWATDTEAERATKLRWALEASDHDCRLSIKGFCDIHQDALEMNDHELLTKYQGKVPA